MKLASALAALLLTLMGPTAAFACGMFVPSKTETEGSLMARQTSLIHVRDSQIDIHARMTVEPGAKYFAWVLPVPPQSSVSLGDERLFEELGAMTRPSIEVDDQRDHDGSSSVGCGAADAGKAGGSLTEVDVLEQGSLGDYDYVRIESSSADAVVEWLQTNEYRVPADAASALQPYADGGMEFVGVKLSRPTDPDDIEDVLATPLVISTPRGADTWPSYPLALSAFSSPERMSVLFYVIADERARIDNYAHVEMSTVADRIAREREELRYVSSYDAIIDALTGENDGRLFVTEAAMPVSADATDHPALAELVGDEDAFLTRIYGRLKPSELDDVIFRPHDQPAAPVSPEQSRVIEGHERHAACSAFGGPSDALPMPIYLLVAFGACRLLWGHNRRSTNR